MKIEKLILKSFLLLTISVGFVSCSDDDDNDNGTNTNNIPEVIAKSKHGAYILSTGAMGSNTASLRFYDLDSKETVANVFERVNGINLGDVGQDMIIYGSKMYIGMYNSGMIYVTDKDAKIIKTIKDDASKLQPRSFETYNGHVYVTLYDGYLARIDTTTLTIDKKIEVGPNPESVKAANNKLYVANSGGMNWKDGYNNTVSIVTPDLASKKDITVAVNPCQLQLDKYNNLYLVSRGNYGTVPNTLQQINIETEEVSILDQGRSYSVFPAGDKLYMLKKEYVNSQPESSIIYYDIINKEFVNNSFITDGTSIKDINNVNIEPTSGYYYVSAANKANNGDLYIFSATGELQSKLDTGSAYPAGVWFIIK